MDHAGDIAFHIGRALDAAGFVVRADTERDREKWDFSVQTRDSGQWYRVSIVQVEPSEDELYWPTFPRPEAAD